MIIVQEVQTIVENIVMIVEIKGVRGVIEGKIEEEK